ncbi:MAG: Na/Pi cotransporter family protein [Oscillibacter sp.]|nr:Na/Pi cotransporter family protein [Oscillibacter sp.]
MDISSVLTLFCGVALFLFGMSLMGDGLKKIAGNRLELLLYKLTSTSWKGILLGTGVTAVIQSSSATSVMVVGFVNSGMMKFRQAIGIILGAILGTSVTGWVIALSELGGSGGWLSLLSTATLTALCAVIGILLYMFGKKQKRIHLGSILLGFAVLMVGMSEMSGAVSPLKDSPGFIRLLTAFSNPFAGILAGAAFTAVLQSASASVGIIQALTVTGAIDFATAFPLILGVPIGAAVPVLLAGMSATTDGRRTAFVYLLISAIGSTLCGVLFYLANAVYPGQFPILSVPMDAVSVALLNTVYRLFCVILLWPGIPLLDRLTCALVKEKPEDAEKKDSKTSALYRKLVPLDERFLTFPSPYMAIFQCRTAVCDMARATEESVGSAFGMLQSFSEEKMSHVEELETLTDLYEDHIGTYLLRVTRKEMSRRENNSVSCYLHTLSDFERIADHAMGVAYVARELKEKRMDYHPAAWKELGILEGAVTENVRLTVHAFAMDKLDIAQRVEPLSHVIDKLCDALKQHHIDRLQSGDCTMEQGISFNDLLTNCRDISDHCAKIARAMLELDTENAMNTHAYRKEAARAARPIYEEYRKKYAV